MSIISKFIGGSIAEPIEAVGNVLDKLFTNEGERLDKQTVYQRLLQQPQMVQAEINKIEASHRSIFVSGWRPYIGWICGTCLGLYFIPQYVLGAYLWVKMCLAQNVLLPYPVNGNELMSLIIPLLGLGLYRTIEKFGNKAK